MTILSHSDNQAELPRRFLPDFLLLSLQSFGRSYGYVLCQSVQAKGLSADLAAVYRALRALQRRELVASAWEPSESGPDRRVYVLTDAGRSAAATAAADLARIRDGLSAALADFDATDPAGPTSVTSVTAVADITADIGG